VLDQIEGRLEEAWDKALRSEACIRRTGHLVLLTEVLCARAELAAARGDPEDAARSFTEAEALVARLQTGPTSELASLLERARPRV
jgi:hypothetical protein